jgi:hypothetical protein
MISFGLQAEEGRMLELNVVKYVTGCKEGIKEATFGNTAVLLLTSTC